MVRRSTKPTTPPLQTPELVEADASFDELRREWRRLHQLTGSGTTRRSTRSSALFAVRYGASTLDDFTDDDL
jgi:hypothetical protein